MIMVVQKGTENEANMPCRAKMPILPTVRWYHFFRISNIKKVINEKHPREKYNLHLMTSAAKTIDLMSNLIEKRRRGMRRVPQYFFPNSS